MYLDMEVKTMMAPCLRVRGSLQGNDRMYDRVYQFNNLYDAYLKARNQKRYRGEVLKFSYNLEENLINLQNELIWKTYRIGEYRSRVIYEPKRRKIVALPFRDRIVQHALNNVIEPIFEKRMIFDSYACRTGKGTHMAARRISYFLGKTENHYFLKADIKSYFASVNIIILTDLIKKRYIQDDDILWLLNEIFESSPVPGLPIGNLISQLFANVYLHELDHYIKNDLSIPYYVRYMDDIVILDKSKKFLKDVLNQMRNFLHDRLALAMNHKTHIGKTSDGIEFVGYRIWRGYKLIKKQSLQRMRKKFRAWKHGKMAGERFLASIGSWIGHSFDTGSHRAVEKIMLDTINELHRRI
jgi:retron-type reverse transcriptase